MSNLKQSLTQRLQQKLSPQQIQLMKLLQIPTALLEQRIKEELMENPALEEGSEENEPDEYDTNEENDEPVADEQLDEEKLSEPQEEISLDEYMADDEIPDYKTSVNNSPSDEDRKEMPVVINNSFQEQLHAQLYLCNFDDREYIIAEQLIGSIDDDGYLRRDLSAVVDDLAFSQNVMVTEAELVRILKTIQSLEPPGVGARTLQECLLLQLDRKNQDDDNVLFARVILEQYMNEFSNKHYKKIAEKLEIDENELKPVMNEILKLNPRPGGALNEGQRSIQHVIPDFIITNNEGTLELTLNSKNAPELRVNKDYVSMLSEYSKDKKAKNNKEAVVFVRQKLDGAKWFIEAINQRNHTLLQTMRAIMEYQYDYFLDGDQKKLSKMVLRDIAEKIGMDISTVSRVCNSKYVQTAFGTFLLKSFFSEGMQTDSGEEVSSKEVKQILTEAISAEDKKKPITDDLLMKVLNEKGYNIARRTVAKYREQLGIPVARLRKEL